MAVASKFAFPHPRDRTAWGNLIEYYELRNHALNFLDRNFTQDLNAARNIGLRLFARYYQKPRLKAETQGLRASQAARKAFGTVVA